MKQEIYHMSEADDLVRLEPNVPNSSLTDEGYEDSKTPRVCFAPSIADCLIGLDRDCTGKTYYVYVPDGDYDVYKPTVKECPQSAATGEVWIKGPVNVKLVAKIDNITPTYKELKYKYGNGKTGTLHKWEHYDCHMIGDNNLVQEEVIDFALPDDDITYDNIETLLNSVNPSRIFLSSDWHIFKNHYKTEKNSVNVNNIIKWCKENIGENDVFMYLGDISYRYADKTDQQRSAEIMASIPGHKILVIGNHDKFLDEDYYAKCGFEFAIEQIVWKNYVFTHRPINMAMYPDNYINIHGHIHNITSYNTTDGSKNVNVYPFYYDNKPVTLQYIVDHFDELIKNNYWKPNAGYGESAPVDPSDKLGVLRNYIFNETKRSELPDSAFGIPEDRKFPLDTEQHVRSAIRLFGHAEESKKKSLAKRINAAAKKYDLAIPKTTQVYKYLNESVADLLPSGVDTIIFDFGGVLVDYNTNHAMITGLQVPNYLAKQIAAFVEEQFFTKLDEEPLVSCSIEEAKDIFVDMAPENIAQHVDEIFNVIAGAVHVYAHTYDLLKTIRAKGYKLYYLSNWAKFTFELEYEFFAPLIAKFDGGLFNFEAGCSKPNEDIYDTLIMKYDLDPDKCVFFDDRAENVIGATNCGMHGILFDEETAKELMNDNFSIPSDANNTILIDTGVQLESVNVNDIGPWYCCNDRTPNDIEDSMYSSTVDDAVKNYCSGIVFKDEDPIEANMFINNGNDHLVMVGKVSINPDMTHEWLIQYPIEYDGDVFTSCICEWSMAACNPIQGIHKPFILKVGPEYNSTINTKQYAFSPDIISDKYLVVNENAQLEVIDADQLHGRVLEAYEFVGNKAYLKRLNEAYKTGKIVDNTVFYTTLTGKPMLCEDQIDFDPSFKKVNFDEMTESIITEMATIRDKYLETIGLGAFWTPVVESVYSERVPFLNKYNKYGDISIREDYDGFYFYSTLTKKRSGSVGTSSMLTEAMIKSIL